MLEEWRVKTETSGRIPHRMIMDAGATLVRYDGDYTTVGWKVEAETAEEATRIGSGRTIQLWLAYERAKREAPGA